jgi:hypothetical protein
MEDDAAALHYERHEHAGDDVVYTEHEIDKEETLLEQNDHEQAEECMVNVRHIIWSVSNASILIILTIQYELVGTSHDRQCR